MIDVIVFLGIQGSGKGTQAELLAEKTGFQHINIGDLFREQISKQTELGKKVQSIIAKGELVNEELVFELVNSSLSTSCPGVIFDGFPRTQAQAEYLLQHYNVLRVYYLELTETEAIERIEVIRGPASALLRRPARSRGTARFPFGRTLFGSGRLSRHGHGHSRHHFQPKSWRSMDRRQWR